MLVIFLGVIGCSQGKQAQTPVKNTFTAAEVMAGLEAAGLPVGNSVEYTADTDTNKLLGRPGQYIGKVNFEDTRIDDDTANLDDSIEVFANDTDLQNRLNYTKSISSQMPMFAQYSYSHKNILLRLDKALTPEQAAEYEKALNNL
jgi:hypothetical protein